MIEWGYAALIVSSALAAAIWAHFMMPRIAPPRRIEWASLDDVGAQTVFLFDDDELVDATPEAQAMLRAGSERLDAWPRLLSLLEQRFPGCGERLATLGDVQSLRLAAADDHAELEAEWRSGLTRITLSEQAGGRQADHLDRFGLGALTGELETTRKLLGRAPILIWKEDLTGAVRWANGAYFDAIQQRDGTEEQVGWPIPKLFESHRRGAGGDGTPRRASVPCHPEPAVKWFDCHSIETADDTLLYAIPTDKLVRAEASLREFVQTLTKTFAHLTAGLAVFDRERRLALFNPALTDLSALEPQFLSTKPTLFEFLDHLRERQRMPEPKDYKTWRRQITEMEAAAATGTHVETWSLPTGQTYRVTGRPHPDGAVAFLFEDISAEISATRRYRSELELGQAVIDSLDEAIAVFSVSGTLILSNEAYDKLWDCESHGTLGEIGMQDAIKLWQEQCEAGPGWDSLHAAVTANQDRSSNHVQLRRRDGRSLNARIAGIGGNATLVGFTTQGDIRARSKLWMTPQVASSS